MALFELRTYSIRPGKMEEWLSFMERRIMPYIISKGMTVNASFRGDGDDSTYVWIRRFDDEAHRVALYEAVYESDEWKKDFSPKIGTLIDREKTVITRLSPTAQSPLQ